MRGYPVIFRCYMQRDHDQYVAFCVDLTLAAQADTYEEARQKLHEQIHIYVYDAIAGDDQSHATELLTRKAPLRYFVTYYVLVAKDRLRDLRDAASTFIEPLNIKAFLGLDKAQEQSHHQLQLC